MSNEQLNISKTRTGKKQKSDGRKKKQDRLAKQTLMFSGYLTYPPLIGMGKSFI